MQRNYPISPQSIYFINRLKNFLQSTGMPFEDLLDSNKITKINKISFFRMIKLLHIQGIQNFDPQKIYIQLSNNKEFISLDFIKNLILNIQNYQKKEPKRQSVNLRNEMNEKSIKIFQLKIRQFIKKQQDIQIYLSQFSLQKTGFLSQMEINQFLISTAIKELFNNKSIRKLITQDIFHKFNNRKQISHEQLLTYFSIKRKPIFADRNQTLGHQKNHNKQTLESYHNSPIRPHNKEKSISPKKIKQRERRIFQPNDKIIKESPKEHDKKQITTETNDTEHEQNNIDKKYSHAIRFYRLERPSPMEYQIMEQFQNLLIKKIKFVDINNPKIAEGQQYTQAEKIFNTSHYHLFEMATSVICREKSRIGIARLIQPKDIIQGKAADCYFLSSIASLISIHAQLIAEKFLFLKNQASFYAIKLFIDGEWQIITTDDRFPCRNNVSVYAFPHTNEIWVMLLQKCWAKIFGSYEGIQEGSPKEGFLALTGAPYEIIKIKRTEEDKQEIMKLLEHCKEREYVATVSGSQELQSLGKSAQEKLGLISFHAYSLLKMIKIKTEILVKLRNPWGRTIWKGDWSYKSSLWTKQLRNQYNYHRYPEDGSFYMPFNLFCRYFGQIVICKVNPFYLHSSIRVKTNKRKSAYISLSIKTKGHYSLSIYQQNKRKYTNSYQNYEYSASRLILMKKKGDAYTFIASRSHLQAQVCTIDFQAEEIGQYIISAKVWWKFWQAHELVVTSYGIDYTNLSFIQKMNTELFKRNLIASYAEHFSGKGKIKRYEKYEINAYCETNFNIQTGIGFIKIKNNSEKAFQSVQEMKLKGLKIIKPDKLPLVFKMKKFQEKIFGFFVNALGYEYNITQKLILF